MAEFKDLPENTSPDGADIIAVAQDSDDVTVKVQLDNLPIVTELASTANGDGASKVAIEDSGANFTSTDVEGALAELHAMMDGLDSWVSGKTYTAPNDVVLLASNNKIYRCITTNSDVTFTPAKWQAVGKDSYTIGDDSATGSNVTLTAPTTDLVRLTSGTLVSIDMIPTGEIGNPIWLLNRTGVAITISDETGATASQRIKTGTGLDLNLPDDATIQLIYDTTESRWQVVGGIGGGGGGGSITVCTITESQTSGTGPSGGSFVTGTWRTRVLNTEDDPGSIVALASDVMTPISGTYLVKAWAIGRATDNHQARLQNTTDATTEQDGSNAQSNVKSNTNSTPSIVDCIVITDGTKDYELQHRCQTTGTFGQANSFGNTEIYAQVVWVKIG